MGTTKKSLVVGLSIVVVLGAVLFALIAYLSANMFGSGTWGSKGTPDGTRDRGYLERVVQHGPFSIEQRSYRAGNQSGSSDFCDYWVTFKGKPIKLDDLDYVNNYNSCDALLLLAAEEPTFVLGSYFDSGGKYFPIIVSTIHGVLNIDRGWSCAIDTAEPWKGLIATDGEITLCGRTWKVLPIK